MSQVLQASIRAGEATTRSAERLLDAGTAHVNLPRHVVELREAAQFPRGPGDPNLLEDAVKKWQAQISRLGQGRARAAGDYTIKSATEQLILDLRKAQPEQVDKVIDRWVLDRARYQARVVARHESVEAFRDVALEGLRDQEWVHGVRWTLSPAHPRPDICDVHAGVDMHGLGAGGYPLDKVPKRHTSCLCSLVPITDPHHLKRQLAKLRGEPEPPKPWLSGNKQTAEQWLMQQSPEAQRAILGPTRARLLGEGQRVFVPGSSNFRKVHNLLGKPKPVRNLGPRIDATPVVDVDRTKMAQPFPDLPGVGKVQRPPPAGPPIPPAPPPAPAAPSPPPAPPIPPPEPPKPVKPPVDVLSKAPGSDKLGAEYVGHYYDSITNMFPAGDGQYVGDLSPGMAGHARRVQQDVAEHFGLPITTQVTRLRALSVGEGRVRNGYYVAGTMSSQTGTMALRVDVQVNKHHHVLVHEAIHTMGGATAGNAYSRMGMALEEVATEELALAYVGGAEAKLLIKGVDVFATQSVMDPLVAWERRPSYYGLDGAYQRWRNKAYSMIAAATGDASVANVSRQLREASLRWKQRLYTSHIEATAAFVDALQPETPEQRTFYVQALNLSDWGGP